MFDEKDHPRGQPKNAGQFIKKSSDGAGGTHEETTAERERLKHYGIADEEEEQKKKVGDYVERFREGEDVENEIVLSDVGEKERKAIEKLTGEKLTATQHVLCLSELRHIEKRHGRNGEHDHSMADTEKYKQIIEVLKNPDSVDFCLDKKGERQYSYNYRDKNNRPAKLLTFTKVYDGYEQMVVETVCDSKYGKLHVITSYIKK